MSAKNASSDATAKPCLDIPLTVPVPATVIDDAIFTLKNVEYLLRDELDVRIGSISDNGRLDGDHHNFTDIAEVVAASKGLRDLHNELATIKHAAQPTPGTRRKISDLTTRFEISYGGLEAIRFRLLAADALKRGNKLKSLQLHIQAFLLDGHLAIDIVEPEPGTDPEAEASAKLAKRDAARARGPRK